MNDKTRDIISKIAFLVFGIAGVILLCILIFGEGSSKMLLLAAFFCIAACLMFS
ncbi:MAG: hypothetical protein MJZ81_05360 [Bacteroidales bacterium]|nr:hypothetical protein [Bacteroidales bacterium]